VLPAAPTVAAIVRERMGISWSRARSLCEQGRVFVEGEACRDPARRVDANAAIEIREQAAKSAGTAALPRDALVFYDRDVVVVDKPAGMLSVADEPGARIRSTCTCERCFAVSIARDATPSWASCTGWTRKPAA
jgi:Pseudouridylate synthases, 23S RNA-specific